MISISLDAWTSPNGMAFMAIIVHYIINKGKLSEYYNLWSLLATDYSIQRRWLIICCSHHNGQHLDHGFVMDNTTNNNTIIEEIGDLCHVEGINFSAQHSQLQCMSHTIHLVVLKVWIQSAYVSISILTCSMTTASRSHQCNQQVRYQQSFWEKFIILGICYSASQSWE
jgi:hypothetical protein